jgi:hypothetical protein
MGVYYGCDMLGEPKTGDDIVAKTRVRSNRNQ